MRICLSHTKGYRFAPLWTPTNALAFTTVTNAVFLAHRTENDIVWHVSTSRQAYQGTEQQLYDHIKQENNGKLYTCVTFSQQGNTFLAHFVTRMRRDLLLFDDRDQLEISESATIGFFSSIPLANRALAVVPSTTSFVEMAYRFPNNPHATVLHVQTPAQTFFLSFGRTKKRCSHIVSIPATFWKIEALLGAGKPWFILQKKTPHEYTEQTISSEQELMRATGWYVERVQ